MVLVHAGHLGRPEAVGLAAQTPCDEGGARGGDGQGRGAGAEDDGQLPVDEPRDVLDLQARGHQGDDLALGVGDGHHGLHLVTERPVDPLGQHPACQGRLDGADEPLADALREGVRVADAVGVHDHDEVDTRPLAGGLGDRLQHLRRIRLLQRLQQAGRVGERLRHGDRAVARRPVDVGARLEQQRQQGTEHQQHDQRHLEDEHLSGDAAWKPFGQRPDRGTAEPVEKVDHAHL